MMKILLLTLFCVSSLTFSGYLFLKKSEPVPPVVPVNTSQSVQTAYMVIHPAANKGDKLVFQGLSGPKEQIFVHFPYQSPCAEEDLPGTGDEPPNCIVTARLTDGSQAQYQYYFDTHPHKLIDPKSICPPCCHRCQIIIRNPKPDHAKVGFSITGTGENEALEILIYDSDKGIPTADTNTAYPEQPVTWFRSGVDTKTYSTAWSVVFDIKKKSPCTNGWKFTNTDAVIPSTCKVDPSLTGTHTFGYTATVGLKSSSAKLVVTNPSLE